MVSNSVNRKGKTPSVLSSDLNFFVLDAFHVLFVDQCFKKGDLGITSCKQIFKPM